MSLAQEKILLCVTTANQLEYTQKTIETITRCNLNDIELLIVDDCSKDGTVKYCRDLGLNIITKKKAFGLTHSWNLCYKYFIKGNYDFLIFANNDILVPQGAIENLISCLRNNIIVGVMSSLKGVIHSQEQAFRNNYKLPVDDENPDNMFIIQNYLNSLELESLTKKIDTINGFFFGLNKNIIKYELHDGNLFDPSMVNVGNETELCERIIEDKVFCLTSFIFHFKGVSFPNHTLNDGYQLDRQLLWSQADSISNNKIRILLYKLVYKINAISKRFF